MKSPSAPTHLGISLGIPAGLKRYPARKNELLQAWDAADELLLKHLGTLPLENKKLLIAGDSFGALSCAILKSQIPLSLTVYTDSYLARKAIEINSSQQVEPLHRLSDVTHQRYDLAVIKLPKNTSFLEDMLCHLSQCLAPGAPVIAAYMIKHQSKASFELLGRIIAPTTTSLAEKKARLIFAQFGRGQFGREMTPSPYPLQVKLEGFETPFVHHSNLFSREKLDIGTRFFLEQLKSSPPRERPGRILDLGCANGVLGIAAKRLYPEATVVFSDESAMAIESARANYENYFGAHASASARFLWTDCAEAIADAEGMQMDLVLCNPPFHQESTVGDFTARRMFTDAKRVLAPRGVLRVIGNSHLKYPMTLKRIFGHVTVVAKNSKFTLMDCQNGP